MGKGNWLWALALLALPAQAEECFSGRPQKISYDDGRVLTIIQRHGDDLTYTTPYEGFQDAVTKTHLMLIPKQGRAGARSTEFRWSSRLPRLKDLVPGFRFDIKGTMKSGTGPAIPYRNVGEVLGVEEVKVGACSYPTLVVKIEVYLEGQVEIVSTDYLSPDLLVVLKSEVLPVAAARMITRRAVAIQ